MFLNVCYFVFYFFFIYLLFTIYSFIEFLSAFPTSLTQSKNQFKQNKMTDFGRHNPEYSYFNKSHLNEFLLLSSYIF